jgi:hypothetical protein
MLGILNILQELSNKFLLLVSYVVLPNDFHRLKASKSIDGDKAVSWSVVDYIEIRALIYFCIYKVFVSKISLTYTFGIITINKFHWFMSIFY